MNRPDRDNFDSSVRFMNAQDKYIDQLEEEKKALIEVIAKANNKKTINSTFKIKISDGYCEYEYPLNLSNENSIDSIITRIYKLFKHPKRTPNFIK